MCLTSMVPEHLFAGIRNLPISSVLAETPLARTETPWIGSPSTLDSTSPSNTVFCPSAVRDFADCAQASDRLNNMKHKNPNQRILMFFNAIKENNLLEKQSNPVRQRVTLFVIASTPTIPLRLLYR